MLSLEGQVEGVKGYGEYLAVSSATCQGLEKFEVIEKESSIEETKDWTKKKILRERMWGMGTSPKSDVGSHLTLECHWAAPPFHPLESPFDELDEKLPNKEKTIKLINYVHNELKIQFAKKLAARLNFLYEVAKEEDPDGVPISPESLRNFIGFLQKTPNLRYPSIVLTPSNEISAQWRTAPNRHFAVVFLPTGEARFVIFTPNPRDPDKTDRLSGITSVDSLIETAQPHGVLAWASR